MELFTSPERRPIEPPLKLSLSRNRRKSIRLSCQIRARFVIREEADALRRARLVVVARGSTCAARELLVAEG